MTYFAALLFMLFIWIVFALHRNSRKQRRIMADINDPRNAIAATQAAVSAAADRVIAHQTTPDFTQEVADMVAVTATADGISPNP